MFELKASAQISCWICQVLQWWAEFFHFKKLVDPLFLGFVQHFKYDNWFKTGFYCSRTQLFFEQTMWLTKLQHRCGCSNNHHCSKKSENLRPVSLRNSYKIKVVREDTVYYMSRKQRPDLNLKLNLNLKCVLYSVRTHSKCKQLFYPVN